MKKKKKTVQVGLGSSQDGLSLQAEVIKLAKSKGFTRLLTSTERRQLKNGPKFIRPFVDAAATRYEAHPQFADPTIDVSAVRDDLAAIASYEAAVTAMSALLRSMQGELLQKKVEVAEQSDTIFNHLKGLSMTQAGSVLESDVDALTKLRRPARRSKKQAAVTPAAQGSPEPTNTK